MRPFAPSVLAAIVPALTAAGCVSMNPSVVDPDAYLAPRAAPTATYQAEVPPGLLPFLDVRIEPMDRLMLVSFDGDPVYRAVELQVFARSDGKEEARVLLERADAVDVYDSPGRVVREDDRRTLEALFAPREVTLQEGAFDYHLRVTAHGLDTSLRMRDREGRELVFEVLETRGEPYLGALIAPLGTLSVRPDFLPIFFLDEFAMVRRSGAEIRIEIDGRSRAPAKLTRLVKGPAAYFSRYSTRVVLAHWNESREATLERLPVEPGAEIVRAGGLEWQFEWREGRPEARAVVARSGTDEVTFRFAPALPDVAALAPGSRVLGRFVVNVNDVPGVVAGDYEIAREGEVVRVVLEPREAWQPPVVRGPSWVSSYRYEAVIDLGSAHPRLESEWTRREGR